MFRRMWNRQPYEAGRIFPAYIGREVRTTEIDYLLGAHRCILWDYDSAEYCGEPCENGCLCTFHQVVFEFKRDARACPVCKSTFDHVLGCPEQDRPR